jgi:hypothetical protein
LTRAKLDFPSAFRKACNEVSNEFPFLSSGDNSFEYTDMSIRLKRDIDVRDMVDGVCLALSRIFGSLRTKQNFGKVYRFATQRLRSLNIVRRDIHDRHMITGKIEMILNA